MTSSIDSKVVPFGRAVDALGAFLSADSESEITVPDGGTVPSLRKLVKDVADAADEKVDQEISDFKDSVEAVQQVLTATTLQAMRAEAAANAVEDSVQYTYLRTYDAELAGISGMLAGQTAYVRSTQHRWRYSGSAWIDDGLAPTASKADLSRVVSVETQVRDSYIGTSTLTLGALSQGGDQTFAFAKPMGAGKLNRVSFNTRAAGPVIFRRMTLVAGVLARVGDDFTIAALNGFNVIEDLAGFPLAEGEYFGWYGTNVISYDAAAAGDSAHFFASGNQSGNKTSFTAGTEKADAAFMIRLDIAGQASRIVGLETSLAADAVSKEAVLPTTVGAVSPAAGTNTPASLLTVVLAKPMPLARSRRIQIDMRARGTVWLKRMLLSGDGTAFNQVGSDVEYRFTAAGLQTVTDFAINAGEYLGFVGPVSYFAATAATSEQFYEATGNVATVPKKILRTGSRFQIAVQSDGLYAEVGNNGASIAALLAFASMPRAAATVQSVSGNVTLDLATSRSWDLTLADTVRSLAFSNVPAFGNLADVFLTLKQPGGSKIVWPSSISWIGGAPAFLERAGSQVWVRLMTFDGGVSWLGLSMTAEGALPALMAYDPFEMLVGDYLADRVTPVGHFRWAAGDGAAIINFRGDGDSNLLETQTQDSIAYFDPAQADYSVWTAMASYTDGTSEQNARLLVRYVDPNNHVYCEFSAKNSTFLVYTKLAGVVDTKNTIAYKLDPAGTGRVIQVRVDCFGPNITLWVDGVEVATLVWPQLTTATKVGIQRRVATNGFGVPRWKYIAVTAYAGVKLAWPPTPTYPSPDPVVPLGATGAWDDTDVNNPNVIADPVNGGWLMDYSGYHSDGSNGGQGTRIQNSGYARASSLAGPWVKDAANPVIVANTDEGFYAFNGGIVHHPGLGKFIRVYVSGSGTRIDAAISTDGYNWTRLGQVLGNSGWHTRVFDPHARIRPDGVIEAVYCGANNGNAFRAFGRMVSTDGVTWTDVDSAAPWYTPNPKLFRYEEIGEPTVFVPSAAVEGMQALLTFDGTPVLGVSGIRRQLHQAITIDGGKTWHTRVGFIRPPATGWMAAQTFDNYLLRDTDNVLHVFHGGGANPGASLNLAIQIAHATVPWAVTNLKA